MAAIFKVATKFRSLYFFTTAEGIGFWTLEASSGVVASSVLISPGLDCPGVSLAGVYATCLWCHLC